MGAQGTTTINFGAFPGSTPSQASVAVTGQTAILATSLAEGFYYPVTATADRTVEDQLYDIGLFDLVVGNLIAGTGFTIYAVARNQNIPLYGQYNVAWVWN